MIWRRDKCYACMFLFVVGGILLLGSCEKKGRQVVVEEAKEVQVKFNLSSEAQQKIKAVEAKGQNVGGIITARLITGRILTSRFVTGRMVTGRMVTARVPMLIKQEEDWVAMVTAPGVITDGGGRIISALPASEGRWEIDIEVFAGYLDEDFQINGTTIAREELETDLERGDETKEVDIVLNFDVDDDGDLVSNVDEMLEGTDPSDPGDCLKKVWYKDTDSDRYTEGTTQVACASSSPYNLTSITILDCDDTDPSIYPGASLNCNNGQDNDCSGQIENWFYQDSDSDTWTTSVSECANSMPSGFTSVSKPTDCDDNSSSIYPGASLNCNNGQDNDCSGQVENWFYQDSDSDTWTTSVSQCANSMPSGFTSVSKPTDCNDTNSSIYPGAPLNCNNGQDNDCSGQVENWFYQDQDSDTWTTSVSQCANSMPSGFTSVYNPTDCNDSNSSIYPGASLNCNNGQDNDCSSQVEVWFYQDQDSDSWTTSVSQCANSMPSGFTSVYNPTDCNDTNSSIYPGASLNCNSGQDNDCSGQVENWFYQDQDSDTWTISVSQCANIMPSGFTSVSKPTDCDDNSSSIYPGASLNCNNGQDNDCSGQVENWFYQDQDSDTWTISVSQCANSMPSGFTSVYNPTDCNDSNSSINPSAPDNTCDSVDNNCNLYIDESTAPCFAPSSLTISTYGLTQVSLSWTYPEPSSNVENFVVEKSPNGITFAFLKSLPRSITSYTDITYLVNKYYYRVYAKNATGSGLPSSVTSAPFGAASLFQKTFGGALTDYSYSVTRSSDGGYVIAGYTNSFGAGLDDMYVVKLDASGNVMWTKTVGGGGSDIAYSIIQSTDGGYVVAGYTDSFGAGGGDIYIVKIDGLGNVMWTKTVGGISVDSAYSLIQSTDGGYVVAGYTYSFGAGSDIYIVKIDGLGNVMWTKTVGGISADSASSVIQSSDGGYVIAGYTNSFGAGLDDMYVVKLDASGNVMWTKTVGGSNYDYASSVIQSTDGGYVVAGSTDSFGAGGDMYVVKLDASGNVMWTKTVGGISVDSANSVIQSSDGGYVVAGYTNGFGAGSYDMYVVKLDASGNVLWTKTVGGSNYDYAWSLIQSSDVGYVVAGYTFSFGAGLDDMYVVKIEGDGDLGCHDSFVSSTTNTGGTTTFQSPVSSFQTPSSSFVSPASYSVASTDIALCIQTFTKTIGGATGDYASSVIQSTDGGYVVAGYTDSFGAGGDMYVVKLDASGNVMWTKTVGGGGIDIAYSIIQSSDGGYVVAGYTNSFGAGYNDIYIVKIDGSGNIAWTKTVGGSNYDEASSVIQSTDGGYVVAGYTDSFGAGGDMYVVKLDASGNVMWTKTVGGSNSDSAYSLIQSTDGGYVVAGSTDSFGAGLYDMYVVKLDASGNVMWTKTVGGSSDDYASLLIQSTDGGYVVVGRTSSFGAGGDMYVVKLDASGNVMWTKTVGGSNSDSAYSLIQSTDGGYVVVGYTGSFGAGLDDIYIVKIDGSGNIVWTKTVGGSNSDSAYSLIQSTDGGYVVAGRTQSFGAGSNDIYIVKAGPSFDTCFSQAITNYTVGSGGSVSSPTSSTSSVSPTVYAISPTTGVGGSVTDVCVSWVAPVLPMCYAQGSCDESISTIPFYYHQSSSDGSGYYRTTSKDSSYGCSVGLGEICIPLLFILYILFKVLPVKGGFKKKMF